MPTFPVDDLTLTDYTDPTKTFGWDASLITPGARRLYTVPDMDGTVPLLETVNTWGNINVFSALEGIKLVGALYTNTVQILASPLTSDQVQNLQDQSGIIALLNDIPSSYTFASLTAKPTTIAGYGITDFNSLGDARWSLLAHTHTFASLTSKPTTIAGYGITDFNSLGDARWGQLGSDNTWTGIQTIDTTVSGEAIRILAPLTSVLITWVNSDLSGNNIVISAPGSIAAPAYLEFPKTGSTLVSDANVVTLANKTFQTTTMASAANFVLNTGTGTKIGTATGQKLGFHNATAVIQRAGAAQAAVATTAATNVTPYGFTTAAQADAIVALVNELRAVLVEKGLCKGAA